MSIRTLGELRAAGIRIVARCPERKPDGLKQRRNLCHWRGELDVTTLVVTRGPGFPLTRLPKVVMCPRCRGRILALGFAEPEKPPPPPSPLLFR